MSIDRTLKLKDALVRPRNVLSRAERINELERVGKFKTDDSSPYGLPKVRVLKARAAGKKKKEEKEEKDTKKKK
ncbi:MAG: small basic protein [Planctomycetota bacterium]